MKKQNKKICCSKLSNTSSKSTTSQPSTPVPPKNAQLQIPTIKQTSDSNNNRARTLTSRTAKLASIGRAASEVPVSSISVSPKQINKATIIPSPINKHPHTYSSPCTQTTTEHNLNATNIFHANRTDATVNRRILDEEDDLSEVQPDAVPNEVL